MPIRLNLLAEQQYAEELRRRDPVKRGYLAGGTLVALALLWWIYLYANNYLGALNIKALTTEADQMEKEVSGVKTNKVQIKAIDDKLEALFELSTYRFLWGSALNTLQYAVADGLELTALDAKQDFTLVPEQKVTKTVKSTIPGQPDTTMKRTIPASATEKLAVTIEGKCFGSAAGDKIEQFRQKVRNSNYFKGWLTNDALASVVSLSLPQSDPSDSGRTFVTFTIKCDFPARTRP